MPATPKAGDEEQEGAASDTLPPIDGEPDAPALPMGFAAIVNRAMLARPKRKWPKSKKIRQEYAARIIQRAVWFLLLFKARKQEAAKVIQHAFLNYKKFLIAEKFRGLFVRAGRLFGKRI